MSYITSEELTLYAADRGVTLTGTLSVLLVKSMDYIESLEYKGSKTLYTQPYQFPRIMDVTLYLNPSINEIPQRVKDAQCVAAMLIDSGEDLQSNSTQAIKREKVDVIEVEYQDKTTSSTRYTALDALLRPYITSSLRATRV